MRQLILEAAIDELQVNSAAAFTLERVAARAGLEPRAIQQLWPNSPALFAATLTSYTSRHLPAAPDTGTLSGDLLDYANSYAEMVNTPIGRRLLDSVIARPTDWDALGVREHYLAARQNFAAVMVRRGIERGECSPATDPGRMIETLTLAVCLPVLIYDRPITPDDCRYAVGLVLDGIR